MKYVEIIADASSSDTVPPRTGHLQAFNRRSLNVCTMSGHHANVRQMSAPDAGRTYKLIRRFRNLSSALFYANYIKQLIDVVFTATTST